MGKRVFGIFIKNITEALFRFLLIWPCCKRKIITVTINEFVHNDATISTQF